MLKINKVKRAGLIFSVFSSSLLILSCDSGGDDSSNNNSVVTPTNPITPTTTNPNAVESYTITVDFVSGDGWGYKVGDTVLIQRTSDAIIIGDQTFSPYQQVLNSSDQGQYTFDADDELLGVATIGRSAKFVLISDGGNQFRGTF